MSCLCGVCHDVVGQPNSLWYAATANKLVTSFVCGDCLSRLPASARHPTDSQQEFDATFGPMKAHVNEKGWYQMCDSDQMMPQFWVSADDLERALPSRCEFMEDFYPYIRMEKFLTEMVRAHDAGTWPPWPWERRSREQLLMEVGPAIRKYLGLPPAPKVEDHPVISMLRAPIEVPPGQARLAASLWDEVIRWYGTRNLISWKSRTRSP